MAVKHEVDVEGRRLALTNLDKVLYPGPAFTKAQVIDYYTRVAKCLLPHFSGRPLTMLRFPDGVRGKSFYEKDAPKYTPAWVHTTEVARVGGGPPIRYICVDDRPTLVWCANVASLELHPFLHREADLNCPTAVVFDLDPGEGMNLVSCAEVAFLLKSRLETAGLECFPKVSGSKGLQIYVPLNSRVTYEETRSFAQALAEVLQRQHPGLIVAEMAKERRRGKVFIDWSQNSDFKTTVGVYSLRAKNDVPYVSAPVSWTELEKMRKTENPELLRFEPEQLLKRIAEIGDLFAPVLSLKQNLAPISEKAALSPSKTRKTTTNVTAKKAAAPKSPKSKVGGASPEFIEPMLLLKTSKLPEGKDWLYEVKLDGYRALAFKAGGQVELRSRNDNDFSVRFAAIVAALRKLPDETVIDGEVVALDEEGRPSFNLLQNHASSRAPLVYYVFDLLMLRGKSMMNDPLTDRRRTLEEKVLTKLEEPIRFSPALEASLPDLVRSVKAEGLEGLVAKRRDSRYQPGQRSGLWQKMRLNQGQELVIGGYTPSAKNFDALVIGYYDDGKLVYAARTRNGFTPALREELFKKLRKLEVKTCPFSNLPEKNSGRWGQGLTAAKMQECRWLKPVTVAQFEFVEWTPENHLRHTKFIALRDDKKASDVKREL